MCRPFSRGANATGSWSLTEKIKGALVFLEEDLCTGKLDNEWSNGFYARRGKELLAVFRGEPQNN